MRRHIAPPLRDHTHAGQPLLLKVKPPRWVILFPGASAVERQLTDLLFADKHCPGR
jgi:hypothetical protein